MGSGCSPETGKIYIRDKRVGERGELRLQERKNALTLLAFYALSAARSQFDFFFFSFIILN